MTPKPTHRFLATLGRLCLVLMLPAARAGAAELTIDLDALLTSPRVEATTLEDPVWTVTLDAGSALFQLPVRISPGTETELLKNPETGLGGARFLGWSVPAPVAEEAAGDRQRASALDEAQDPPRLTRELTVTGDGALSWEAARLGRGYEASASGSLYAFAVDADLLRVQQPERPARVRGQDRAAARVADDTYRQERQVYDALRDAVDALPKQIVQDIPPVVWLVYERRRPGDRLLFESDGRTSWTVDPADFAALRTMAGSAGRGGASAVDLRPDRLLDPGQPLGTEALALAAGRAVASGATGGARSAASEPDPPEVGLAEAVADRGPEPAVRRLIGELSAAVPPTPTTVRLIARAAPRAGTYGRVAALRAQLLGLAPGQAGTPDLETSRAVVDLQALLEDPEGPAVSDLIGALGDAGADRPALVEAAAAGLKPARLPEPRLRAFAIAVMAQAAAEAAPAGPDARRSRSRSSRDAGPSGLAGVLLDRTLLRSFDPSVVSITLKAMDNSAGGGSRLSPLFASLRRSITAPTESAGPNGQPAADAEGAAGVPIMLPAGSLVLSPAGHGLLQQLRSGDPAVRTAAASSLRLFRLPAAARSSRGAEADETLEALLAATGDAAPAGLITLLSRSPDSPAVNAALLRLLARSEGPAAGRVLLRLRGSDRALGDAVAALPPEEATAVARAALSDGRGTEVSDVAGLVLERDGARFLGDSLAAGHPVDAAGLAAAVGDEAALLRLAGDDDDALARAAMAALAAAAGADAAGQTAAVDAMTQAGTSPEEAWPPLRERFRLAQLARAAGSYRLVVTTGPDPEAGTASGPPISVIPGRTTDAPEGVAAAPPANAAAEVRRLDLGVVVLSVTDEGLQMVGDPLRLELAPDRPAIRLADPMELGNFPGEEILTVPLAAASGPLDLSETPNGWRGFCPLGVGGRLGLELIREGAALPPSAG